MSAGERKYLEQIFYTVTVLTVLVSGILWLGNMNDQVAANTEATKNLQKNDVEHNKQFEEIRIRLTHIEDAVE